MLILTAMLFLFHSGILQAQVSKPLTGSARQNAIADIETKNSSITSFDGTFRQRRESTMLAQDAVSSGRISLQSDGSVLWAYEKPNVKTIEIKNGNVIVDGKSSNSRQGVARHIASMLGETLVNKRVVDDEVFDCKIYDEQTSYRLDMTPRRRGLQRIMERIEITYLKSNGTVSRIVMTENDGNRTIIDFSIGKVLTKH